MPDRKILLNSKAIKKLWKEKPAPGATEGQRVFIPAISAGRRSAQNAF